MGYANEIGESFKYVLPAFYKPSYALALAYVIGDVQDKASRLYKTQGHYSNAIILQATDALVWQLLASVCLPGFTINRVVGLCRWVLPRLPIQSQQVIKWMPTVCGLATIPFIVHPLDHLTTVMMDKTIRRCYPSDNK